MDTFTEQPQTVCSHHRWRTGECGDRTQLNSFRLDKTFLDVDSVREKKKRKRKRAVLTCLPSRLMSLVHSLAHSDIDRVGSVGLSFSLSSICTICKASKTCETLQIDLAKTNMRTKMSAIRCAFCRTKVDCSRKE